MTNREVLDVPVAEAPSPGLQLIWDLRNFFSKSSREPLPSDRPCDWYCPACNVWGRGVRPAVCWCCRTRDVDYRVAPSMTGSHRFLEPNGQEGT